MRVAFGHYCSADDISGVSTWLLRLANDLRSSGVEVAVALMDVGNPDDPRSPLELALNQAGVHTCKSLPSGKLKKDVQATLDFLNSWQPDIFLPQCNTHHFVAAAIAGLQGLPWALTLHSDDPDYWAIAESLPPQQSGGKVVCVSRHIQSELVRRTGCFDSSLIANGVPIPEQTARHNSHPFRVVYSGRLWDHQKRISLVTDVLIRACGTPGVEIAATVIGDGYARSACEANVCKAGLQGRITFVGRQSMKDIQKILQESQAILLMSDFEGLPLALMEGMAAGLVPVARAIPSGIPELVRDQQTGLLVGEDPDGAAAALVKLATDPELWQRCSAGARQLVQTSYNQSVSQKMWLDWLSEAGRASTVTYPVLGMRGVDFSRLSPLMLAPYQRKRPWQSLQVRQRSKTAMARLKGAAKGWINPPA